MTETNYVHDVEKTIQSVVDAILKAQREGFPGGRMSAGISTVELRLPTRIIGLAELRRLKRQFLQLNNFYTQSLMSSVATSFVEYLNMYI